MNSPLSKIEAMRLQNVEAEDKMRLAAACRVAAGMLGNPQLYRDNNWRSTVAYEAVLIADKIIQQVRQS